MLNGHFAKTRRRAALVGANALNTLFGPLLNLVVSLAVVRLYSLDLWGHFVSLLIAVQLATHVLFWGNKEYLIRQYSRTPSRIAIHWQSNLASRLPLLVLLGLVTAVLPVEGTRKLVLLAWAAAAVLQQSLEALVVYRRRFAAAFAADVLAMVLVLAVVLLSPPELSVDRLAGAFAAGQFLKFLLLGALFRGDLRHRWEGHVEWGYFMSALPFFLLGLTGMLQSKTDLYCVAIFLDEEAIGRYQVLMHLLIYLQVMANIILQPFLKNLYRLPVTALRRMTVRLSLAGVVIAALGAVAAAILLATLYHIHFSPAMLVIGGLFVMPIYGYIIIIYRLYAANMSLHVLSINAGGIVANLILNLLLIATFGIFGALIASTAAQWGMLAAYGWLERRIPEEPARPAS